MARPKALAAILLVASLSSVFTAHAVTRDFTNRTAFEAATTNLTMIGFNGILSAGVPFQNFGPLTEGGVIFSTPPASGTFVNVTTASYYSPHNYPVDFITNSVNETTQLPNPDNELVITFTSPVLAAGINYGSARPRFKTGDGTGTGGRGNC